jgi:hypothetical protein
VTDDAPNRVNISEEVAPADVGGDQDEVEAAGAYGDRHRVGSGFLAASP